MHINFFFLQLEEQKIELEGTKAQLRVSRQLSIKQKRTLTSSVLIQTDSPKVAFVLTQTPDILNDAVDTGTQTVEKSVSPCQQYLSNPALDTIKTQSRIPTPIKSRASSLIRTRGDTSIGSLTSLGSKGDKKGNSLRTENKGSPEAVKEKVSVVLFSSSSCLVLFLDHYYLLFRKRCINNIINYSKSATINLRLLCLFYFSLTTTILLVIFLNPTQIWSAISKLRKMIC